MTASRWKNWIGPVRRTTDTLSPEAAKRWLATFDLPDSAGAMPQGIHFCLCLPDTATARLGPDGHPEREGEHTSFLPPIPLGRRMWAGSRITFDAPLRLGAAIARTSRIVSITEKVGGSGHLVFVDILHEILADGEPAVREVQTVVYRAMAAPDAPLSPETPEGGAFDHAGWEEHRVVVPDPRLLFRYSALTFNTHRIHYDAPYAREVERYRGLVVHGPLTASLLLQLAAERLGDNALREFSFRGLSPAIAGEPLHLVMREEADRITLAAFADDGRQVVQASAQGR